MSELKSNDAKGTPAAVGDSSFCAHKGGGWKWLIAGAFGAVVMAGGVAATWLAMRNQQATVVQKQDVVATTAPAKIITPETIVATTLPATTLPADSSSLPRRLRGPSTKQEQAQADQRQQIELARQRYLSDGDFQGFVTWLETNSLGDSPLAKQYRSAVRLQKIAILRLQSATRKKPLLVKVPEQEGGSRVKIWMDEIRRIVIRSPDKRERTVQHLPPRMMLGVYQAVAASPAQKKTADFLFNDFSIHLTNTEPSAGSR